jgi:hypothetical protein
MQIQPVRNFRDANASVLYDLTPKQIHIIYMVILNLPMITLKIIMVLKHLYKFRKKQAVNTDTICWKIIIRKL